MKKKLISIFVVIAILIAIAGIWLLKNHDKIISQLAENNENITSVNEDFKFKITSEYNLDKLKSYHVPIIIDFGSDSCIPCREMAPALKQLNSELQGEAIIRYIDVWRYPELADGYSIELIPTQIFINSDGTPYAPKNAEELGLELVKDENGNHIYTRHIGGLTLEQMKYMLKEMGLDE